MQKSLLEKYIRIVEGVLVFSIVLSIIIAFTVGLFDSLVALGTMSLIDFALLFFFNIGYSKVREKHRVYDNDYFNALLEFYNNNPEQFDREYKKLLRYGARYIALVFILVVLSIVGVILIGVQTGINMGGFGVFVAGLIAVLYTIIKSFFVKLPPVGGYEITAENAPETIKIIEKARAKTNSPAFHKILLKESANCSVLRNKRKNYMFVGIYVLVLLTPEELESLFIHEFAHIYKKDPSMNSFFKWDKILENLQKRRIIANTLLKGFAENYITKIQFYYTVSSKQREIAADKEVAKFIDKEIYAKASMKLDY